MNLKPISYIVLGILAAGCSSTSEDNATTSQAKIGYLIDSAVGGVSYTTSSGLSGVTSSDGAFEYQAGDTVTFTIGAIEIGSVANLGSVSGDEVVTPLDLAGTADVNHPQVQNTLRLLQSLDDDGDPTNGINIPTSVSVAATTPIDLTAAVTDFEADTNLSGLLTTAGTTLVSATTATDHFNLFNNYLSSLSVYGAWTLQPLDQWVNAESELIIFFPTTGNYFQWSPDTAGDDGKPNAELGTVSYNSGVLSGFTHTQDGRGGFDDGNGGPYDGQLTVTPDVTTMSMQEAADITFHRIISASNPLVGAWSIDGTFSNTELIVFLPNNSYFQYTYQPSCELNAYDYNDLTLPCADSSVEIGTYSLNNNVISNIQHIVNGVGGLDEPGQTSAYVGDLTISFSADLQTMTMTDKNASSVNFTRVK